ncbi:MAG: hypothetical protein H6720_28275 [Sandaracinus sp.]|nr:hypothetical protein [Sandaracinus sp.]
MPRADRLAWLLPFVVLACASVETPPPRTTAPDPAPDDVASAEACAEHPDGTRAAWAAIGELVATCAQDHLREGVAIVGALDLVLTTAPDGHVRTLEGEVRPAERREAMLACLRSDLASLRLPPTETCAQARVEVALSSELETRQLGRAARVRLPDGTMRTLARPRGEARFEVTVAGGMDALEARRRAHRPLGEPLETCFARAVEAALRDQETIALDEPLVLDVRWIGAIPPSVEVSRAPSPTLRACAADLSFEGTAPAAGAWSARYVVMPRGLLHPELVAAVEARAATSAGRQSASNN